MWAVGVVEGMWFKAEGDVHQNLGRATIEDYVADVDVKVFHLAKINEAPFSAGGWTPPWRYGEDVLVGTPWHYGH